MAEKISNLLKNIRDIQNKNQEARENIIRAIKNEVLIVGQNKISFKIIGKTINIICSPKLKTLILLKKISVLKKINEFANIKLKNIY